MTNLAGKLVILSLYLAAVSSHGTVLTAEDSGSFHATEWSPVTDQALDGMRGGFDVGQALTVSFGIVRSVTINGNLVTQTSFNLPDITKINDEQAKIASLAIAETGVIQNGIGNILTNGVRSELPASTVIQNTLNDQTIQTLTVINAGVNSMGMLKSINTQTTLKDALLGSLKLR